MQALRFSLLTHRAKLLPFPVRSSYFSKFCLSNGGKPKLVEKYNPRVLFSLSSTTHYATTLSSSPIVNFTINRHFSTNPDKDDKKDLQENEEPLEKLSLIKRYKKMFKEYWYVLLPVHFATSIFWFGSFYYASTCGIDIIPFLEYVNLPEFLIEPLRSSSLGHIAVASALYKLATPARYMVTVGASTFAVNVLKKRGLIRPVPTKAQFKTIIQSKLKKSSVSEKDN